MVAEEREVGSAELESANRCAVVRGDENLEEPVSTRNRKNEAKLLCRLWIGFVENCRERRKSK